VSLLVELCSKRRWGAPQFELCFECGPDHMKNFLFKVTFFIHMLFESTERYSRVSLFVNLIIWDSSVL